jgi:hypothetical protein
VNPGAADPAGDIDPVADTGPAADFAAAEVDWDIGLFRDSTVVVHFD